MTRRFARAWATRIAPRFATITTRCGCAETPRGCWRVFDHSYLRRELCSLSLAEADYTPGPSWRRSYVLHQATHHRDSFDSLFSGDDLVRLVSSARRGCLLAEDGDIRAGGRDRRNVSVVLS